VSVLRGSPDPPPLVDAASVPVLGFNDVDHFNSDAAPAGERHSVLSRRGKLGVIEETAVFDPEDHDDHIYDDSDEDDDIDDDFDRNDNGVDFLGDDDHVDDRGPDDDSDDPVLVVPDDNHFHDRGLDYDSDLDDRGSDYDPDVFADDVDLDNEALEAYDYVEVGHLDVIDEVSHYDVAHRCRHFAVRHFDNVCDHDEYQGDEFDFRNCSNAADWSDYAGFGAPVPPEEEEEDGSDWFSDLCSDISITYCMGHITLPDPRRAAVIAQWAHNPAARDFLLYMSDDRPEVPPYRAGDPFPLCS